MIAAASYGRVLAFGRIPAFRRFELYMERYRAAAELADRELGTAHALRFLDVGSGEGRLKSFFDSDRAIDWHGVDFRDHCVRTCTSRGYRMAQCDLERERLPYADDTFDLVVGLHMLEHVGRPAEILRDMMRVLKPGGVLIVGVPTKPPIAAIAMHWGYSLIQRLRPQLGRTCNCYSAPGFRRFVMRTVGPAGTIVDFRGFRLLSARRQLPLEDWRWFYRANTWFGRHCPVLTPEVNIAVRRLV